jgi:crotonobetainyl-CoA:carnitine CoA-transferase CaiB-like acyl-CoA transferase
MSEQLLSGVRVLEIGGGIGAGYATRWMTGFGADVVRTEGPAGALTPDEEVYLAAGKRRVELPDDQVRAFALRADILVEDTLPGTLAARGLDIADLRKENPALVAVSITPFGQTGPASQYGATNGVVFAMGGIMSLTGHPSRPPLINAGSQAYYLGGLNGFSAAVTAYYGALVHGEGDHIDISMQECAAGMLELYGAMSEYDQVGPLKRSGNHVRAVWGIYPCADGYAGVCCLERQVKNFFRVVGDPTLQEERFQDITQRAEHDDELQAIMYGWFAQHTKAEILELGTKHKVPMGAVMTPADLLANESLAERGYFDHADTPQGTATFPGRPFLGLPWEPRALHAPGEDTGSVVTEWLEAGR